MSEAGSGAHRWGAWTAWCFYGSGLDIREHYCLDCPASSDEKRAHVHRFDEFGGLGPGGTLVTVKACRACGDSESRGA